MVSSSSRPVLLIGGRLIGWFLRLVLLAPVVASCSIQSCPQKEKFQHPCRCSPVGEVTNEQHVAPSKAIDTNIRRITPSSRSSTQAALLTCGARGENRAHEFLHLFYIQGPWAVCIVVDDAVFKSPRTLVYPEVLKPSARIPLANRVQWTQSIACSYNSRALERWGMGVLDVGVM